MIVVVADASAVGLSRAEAATSGIWKKKRALPLLLPPCNGASGVVDDGGDGDGDNDNDGITRSEGGIVASVVVVVDDDDDDNDDGDGDEDGNGDGNGDGDGDGDGDSDGDSDGNSGNGNGDAARSGRGDFSIGGNVVARTADDTTSQTAWRRTM